MLWPASRITLACCQRSTRACRRSAWRCLVGLSSVGGAGADVADADELSVVGGTVGGADCGDSAISRYSVWRWRLRSNSSRAALAFWTRWNLSATCFAWGAPALAPSA